MVLFNGTYEILIGDYKTSVAETKNQKRLKTKVQRISEKR